MIPDLFETQLETINQRLANMEHDQKRLRAAFKVLVHALINTNEIKYGDMKQIMEKVG